MRMGRDEKIEGKQIGEDHRETERTSALILFAVIKKILDTLDLKDKKAKVEIQLDGKKAVEATQNKGLTIKRTKEITTEDARYIERAISVAASESKEPLNRDLSIKVNGEEVFRLKDGVVELNSLAREQQVKRAKAIAQEFTRQRQQGKQPTLKEVAHTIDKGEQQSETAPKNVSEPPSKDPTVNPEVQPAIIILEREVQNRVEEPTTARGLSGVAEAFNQAQLGIQQSISSFVDRTRERFGIDPESRSLRQDLESLAVAHTAKKLIAEFGTPDSKGGQSFGGATYQIHAQGSNLTVHSTHRGTILEVQDGQIKSNLEERDVKQFREIDKQLMHYKHELSEGRDRDKGASIDIG